MLTSELKNLVEDRIQKVLSILTSFPLDSMGAEGTLYLAGLGPGISSWKETRQLFQTWVKFCKVNREVLMYLGEEGDVNF